MKTKYALAKNDECHTFESEVAACRFLGAPKGSVSEAWHVRGTCYGWLVTRIGTENELKGYVRNQGLRAKDLLMNKTELAYYTYRAERG